MVATRSDEIQALIESKLKIKFKELQLSLIEEIKKNIAEDILTEIREVIQNEIRESCMCSFVVLVLQQHVKNLKQQNENSSKDVKKKNSIIGDCG